MLPAFLRNSVNLVAYQVHPVEVDQHSQRHCHYTLDHDYVTPPLISLLLEESNKIGESQCNDDVTHVDDACAEEENGKEDCINRVPYRVIQMVHIHHPSNWVERCWHLNEKHNDSEHQLKRHQRNRQVERDDCDDVVDVKLDVERSVLSYDEAHVYEIDVEVAARV